MPEFNKENTCERRQRGECGIFEDSGCCGHSQNKRWKEDRASRFPWRRTKNLLSEEEFRNRYDRLIEYVEVDCLISDMVYDIIYRKNALVDNLLKNLLWEQRDEKCKFSSWNNDIW